MSNLYLYPVYRDVFGKEFDVSNFSDRLKMQKMVYLLQNLGISVGNYNFIWYKHGPYSGELQNDMLVRYNERYVINYSRDAEETITKLKNTIFMNRTQFSGEKSYNDKEWLECLGSLHYIKTKILSSDASNEKINEALIKRKPHLSNVRLNTQALEELKKLFN